jgi:hypothetical protein
MRAMDELIHGVVTCSQIRQSGCGRRFSGSFVPTWRISSRPPERRDIEIMKSKYCCGLTLEIPDKSPKILPGFTGATVGSF